MPPADKAVVARLEGIPSICSAAHLRNADPRPLPARNAQRRDSCKLRSPADADGDPRRICTAALNQCSLIMLRCTGRPPGYRTKQLLEERTMKKNTCNRPEHRHDAGDLHDSCERRQHMGHYAGGLRCSRRSEIAWDPDVKTKITFDGKMDDWVNAGYTPTRSSPATWLRGSATARPCPRTGP